MVRGIPQQRPNVLSTPGSGATPLTVVSSTLPGVCLSNSPTNTSSHFNKVIVLLKLLKNHLAYYQFYEYTTLGPEFNAFRWTITKLYESKQKT